MTERYDHRRLTARTAELFTAAGLDAEIAAVVADILVEADLLGYATHGLQFVPAYMNALEKGVWTTSGTPQIIEDRGASMLFDANWLPGQWAVIKALEVAMGRTADHGVVTAVIKRSHNISCLATYCKRAAEAGYLMILTTSAPGNAAVAPAGGRQAVYSTSPFAAGIPTDGHPVLFDTATSATTNRMIERTRRAGEKLSHPALVDADGKPSDDPEAFYTDPPGAILPAGGLDGGHKGFALAILVEALTSGLAGWGRGPSDEKAGGNTVFLQLINPAAFGGSAAFSAETNYFAELCRNAAPMIEDAPVRMPGDRAFALHDEQCETGVRLHPEILKRMAPLFVKHGINSPDPL